VIARLKDVALLANVSVRTVSNVVNDYPHVSAGVRQRVAEAIRQLEYRPNLAARVLSSGRSGLISLAVPCDETPYPAGLVREIVRHAGQRGLRVVVDPRSSVTPPARDAPSLPVDATLLTADLLHETPIDDHLVDGAPLIVLGESPQQQYDSVAVDTAQAARDAVTHLLDTGRTRIAAIGAWPHRGDDPAQPDATGAGLRLPDGCLRAMTGRGHADGYHAARELLDARPRPEAFLCRTDQIAVGVLRAVADAGLRVPQDVAVIGVGESEESSLARPALTTVAADPAVVAREALDLVTARLRSPGADPARVTVPHVIQVRESTRATS
jgi:DNA-binding LacI/PurR family transcriptional regulator